MPSLDILVSIYENNKVYKYTATVTSKISTNYSNSLLLSGGQAVFLASRSLVPANTACYAGYRYDRVTLPIAKRLGF
jgi:tricorn protease-like protein